MQCNTTANKLQEYTYTTQKVRSKWFEARLKVKIKYFFYKIFITISGCQIYEQEFQQSIKNPEEYWGKIAEDIVWTKKWQKVLDDSASPFTKWFVGGRLSLCYNALGKIAYRHINSINFQKITEVIFIKYLF